MNNYEAFVKSSALPKNYEITIEFVSGKVKNFTATAHFPINSGIFEFHDVAGVPHFIPISNVFEIYFDKNFKILMEDALQKKKEAQKKTDS